jgi:hypothetical protein
VLLAVFCPLSIARAADLSFDGEVHAARLQGLPLLVEVTGTPGAEAFLVLDLAPGPVQLFGQTIELAFSPSMLLLQLGPVPPGGTLTLASTVPMAEAALGQTIYAVAVVASGPTPASWDYSNGASLHMLDRDVQLAGNALAAYPFVEHVKAFNEFEPVVAAVDPSLYPWVAGETADVYVVAHKSRAQWLADGSLVDVSPSGAETVTFTASGVAANTVVVDGGALGAESGAVIGAPYDVVVDLDQDGAFGGSDLIDGFDSTEAGLYVVHDIASGGPLAVTEILYSGGAWLGQNTFFPSDIASMGELPLVVISHGNGHNYQWYDHIGNHLASYGWVVMSHENNTGPGVGPASITTLTNTDYLLGNLATIGGGVLAGHIDAGSIVWLGHSRGGEGVTRAYDRLVEGNFVPVSYTSDDIRLISSIAPTDFLGTGASDPHDKPYHLWVGGSDSDVTGCADNEIVQSFHLLGRAQGERMSISLHGVGHGNFHNGTGAFATGPCLVGKSGTHAIVRGHVLALVEHVVRGNLPAGDFLWRQWEHFRPIGSPDTNPCVVVDLTCREANARVLAIDDFQTHAELELSSSGGAVSGTATIVAEGLLDDPDGNFTWDGEALSGFSHARGTDSTRGLVLEFDGSGDKTLSFALVGDRADARPYRWLSFRAAQVTRHPLTTAVLDDLTFAVTLRDEDGASSTVGIGAFGAGIEEPYQRTGCGSGAGWGNEFETIRIPVEAFLSEGRGLDLSRLAAVTLELGPSHGSPSGRLGFDDLEWVED